MHGTDELIKLKVRDKTDWYEQIQIENIIEEPEPKWQLIW